MAPTVVKKAPYYIYCVWLFEAYVAYIAVSQKLSKIAVKVGALETEFEVNLVMLSIISFAL